MRVLVSRGPGETRVALMEGHRLAEIKLQRLGAESLVGNIVLGRVRSVNRAIDAAFVDIGTGRDGFLAVAEARPPQGRGNDQGDAPKGTIGDFVAEGDAVLVQVSRDATETKGAKLTTHVSIPGAMLVLRPNQPGVAISRRIGDEEERARLTDAVLAAAPEVDGFVVRTAAAGAPVDAIEGEAAQLAERWRQIRLKRANSRAPALLLAEPAMPWRVLRDLGPGIENVTVDDAGVFAELKSLTEAEMPALSGRIQMHTGPEPLFEAEGVEAAIEAALDPVVPLPSGGRVTISETPALVAVDVDTGGADAGSGEETALACDLDAADAIAREIRLRNLSGLIAVDFVPVRDARRAEDVVRRLRDALANDPQAPRVAGRTTLGLVEMTRRRQGVSLLEALAGPWAAREGRGPAMSAETRALQALRRATGEGRGMAAKGLVLGVPGDVAEVLAGPLRAALKQAEAALGLEIRVEADQSLAPAAIGLTADKGER